MSALVPHLRPTLDDVIRSGQPVSADTWATLAGLANWCNGHGGMLIPWAAIGYEITNGDTRVFRFYVAPKLPVVERVWCVNLRAGIIGATADVTCSSASTVTVPADNVRTDRSGPTVVVREPRTAKTGTVGEVSVSIKATGGAVIVESIGMYEQTRRSLTLDTNDYGVDLTTVRPRQPIADFPNRSAAAVADAYKNLDARRAGLFDWSTPTEDAIEITSGSFVDLFDLAPVVIPALVEPSDTVAVVNAAIYACAIGGDGELRVESSEGDDTVVVTGTWAWYTFTLDVSCEDLSTVDGRRGATWATVQARGRVTTATSIEIAAVSYYRATKPV